MGIAGNQMADELTKEGGGTGHPCPTPFPKSELKNRVNELINAKWEKRIGWRTRMSKNFYRKPDSALAK